MRTNHSKWTTGVLAACFAVALLGVGCGDDEPTDAGMPGAGTGGASGTGTSGTGGTTGGTGGAKAGTGGASGTGTTATPAMCTTQTVALGVPMACASCLCTMDTKNAAMCAATPNGDCWKLIQCVRDTCPTDPANSCATGPVCMGFLAGGVAGGAQAVGALARGACGTMCATEPDGGGDAGL